MKKLKANKKISDLFFFIIVITFGFFTYSTVSKYLIQTNEIRTQESKEFYFESEIANVEGKEYKINNWDGINSEKIEIDVKNYLNSLLKTGEEIKYKIKADIIDDTTDSINDEELVDVVIYDKQNVEITEEQECILSNSDFNTNIYFLNIIPKTDTLENGKQFNIEVTISSIEPYTKDLKANIQVTVNKTDGYTVELADSENGEYVILNLQIANLKEDITISYDNTKLTLDMSNYLVNNVNITQEDNMSMFTIGKDSLEKSKNYEICFVKQANDINLGVDIIIE